MQQPNRIRQLREEKGMTQMRLSMELEVSQETVSAYESGKHYPSLKLLLRMRKLFGADMDYIMGASPVRQGLAEKTLSEPEAELLSLFRALKPVQKEKAAAYLRGMLDGQ